MVRILVTLALALLMGVPAVSATLVDTGQATNPNNGYTVAGPASQINETISWAARFTLAHAAVIASIEAGIQTIDSGDVVFAIYDAASGLPEASAPLFTTLVTLTAASPDPVLVWDGAFGLSWALDAGTYWLAIVPPAGSPVWTSLNFDPPHPLAAYATRQTGQGWTLDPAYTPFAVRIRDASTSLVPEPASWVLLIAGFGVTGTALRRRRAATTG